MLVYTFKMLVPEPAVYFLLCHMHMKFEINRTKIKGSCQSERKVVTHNSKSYLPLDLIISNAKQIDLTFSNIDNSGIINDLHISLLH